MRSDGSHVQRPTHTSTANQRPAFSPGGRRIAFDSIRPNDYGIWVNGYEIYTVRRDGSHRRRLTPSRATSFAPSFSPSGKKIGFARVDHGQGGLYVMEADGSRAHRIQGTSRADFEPD
jgi:TolB protein